MLSVRQQGSLTRPLLDSNEVVSLPNTPGQFTDDPPSENSEGINTHGFKEQVFTAEKLPSNDGQTNTRISSTGKGYGLICPISVLDTSVVSGECQYVLDMGVQLSLPFNIHYIDHSLFLAPNGRWSELDYVLNKDPLVNEFLADFKRWSKLKRFSRKVYFDAFNMVLANLIAVHYSASQLLLSRSNGKRKSSNPIGIDNRTISLVTDYLADRGFIDLHIGRRNDTDKNASWCIPLMPLIAFLDKHDARFRLHSKTQFAVVRDADKNAIPMYTDRTKAHRLNRLARPVRDHYETWLSHTATLDDSYLLPWLKRLFNKNMELGGRFYGHYQQIPSTDRKRIRIDGDATVELDYKSLHMALLYSLEGLSVTGDPYLIDRHKDKRPAFKSMCLRLVNSDDLVSFMANITRSGNPKVQQEYKRYKVRRGQYEYLKSLGLKAAEPSKPMSIRKGFIENIPAGANGGDYLRLILERHQPIAHHFGTKNIGLRLQKMDSDLMALALKKLEGIPCLPVHDSIRCRVSDMGLVNHAMIAAFKELFGQGIVVTNDSK